MKNGSCFVLSFLVSSPSEKKKNHTCLQFIRFFISIIKGCVRYILLVCFVCLKESTCETRKNAFYFTTKALLVLEIINQLLTFQIFKYHDVIKCPRINTKHILVNNLGSKCSLVIKFGQFMQYYKIIFFIKKFYKKCGLETSSKPFLVFKKSSVKKILWRSAC